MTGNAPSPPGEGKPAKPNRLMGLASGLVVYLAGASGFFMWAISPRGDSTGAAWGLWGSWIGAVTLIVAAPLTASMVSRRSWRFFQDFDLKTALLTIIIGVTTVIILANLPPLSTYGYPEVGGFYFGPHGQSAIWFFALLTVPFALVFCLVLKFIAEAVRRRGAIAEVFWESGGKSNE